MLIIKNDKSQLVININLNIDIIYIIEIILNPEWSERFCDIQNNWSSNYKYAELSFNDMYVYLLTNDVGCFINVQHFDESQFNKEDMHLYNLPKQLQDFVLTEPILSLGTTNLMWSNGVELNSLNSKSNEDEVFFINTFFNEPRLKEINFLIGKKYDYKINAHQFNILLNITKSKAVARVSLQSAFDVIISDMQMQEMSETGFQIS